MIPPTNLANSSRPKRRRFSFGLGSVFVTITILAVAIGLPVAKQRRMEAIQRRYDAFTGKLLQRIETPPAGYKKDPNNWQASGLLMPVPTDRPKCLRWFFWLDMAPAKAVLKSSTLLGEMYLHYGKSVMGDKNR